MHIPTQRNAKLCACCESGSIPNSERYRPRTTPCADPTLIAKLPSHWIRPDSSATHRRLPSAPGRRPAGAVPGYILNVRLLRKSCIEDPQQFWAVYSPHLLDLDCAVGRSVVFAVGGRNGVHQLLVLGRNDKTCYSRGPPAKRARMQPPRACKANTTRGMATLALNGGYSGEC